MPTTTDKEHRDEAPSLEPRTHRRGGRSVAAHLAALLNPARPFAVALRQRNLRRLFAGLVTSQAGDWLYNLALLAFVYERTGSAAWVGITTAARIVPEVVLGPIGGVLADRHDRRAVMIGSDLLRAAAMAALVVLAVAGGPIVLAPVLAALCTAAGAAYPQCVVAVMPRLVDEADLPAANAARISITSLCIIAGPLIGAVLLLLGSAAATFAVNGASFLVGAVVVAALPREATRRPAGAAQEAPASLRADLVTGWRALREHPDTLPLVGADFVSSTVYGVLTVLFVLLGQRLGLGAAGYGYLLSAFGAGGILAAGLADRAAASQRPRRVLIAAVAAVGLPLLLLAPTGSTAVTLMLAAAIGAGALTTEVVADTTLQRSLDPTVFARAYGLVVPACVAGIVVGALVAPPCVAMLGLDATLMLTGALVLTYGALAFVRPAVARPALAEPAVA
jgi:predicted MFS family arabinose efflux permease